ncbi:hypothetical protein FrEUN1fDRAFT_5551 [Parafrankia sp. EUN1f]|nr:hypothetical protein FrEUN1fDRAFT_5551 [Parafrankia sp. EUN1f]
MISTFDLAGTGGTEIPRNFYGVHAFGAAVVVGQGESGVDGRAVEVEPAGKGMQVRQVRTTGGVDPLVEPVGVAIGGAEEVGEAADESGEGDHFRAGGGEFVEPAALALGEAVGSGEQEPGDPPG